MQKIDHRKILKHLYEGPRKIPAILEIPTMNFLCLDGRGKPTGMEFQQAAETLYPVAYTLKYRVRAQADIDFHVMPMEVRWNIDRQKRQIAWTMMLMQPDIVNADMVHTAVETVKKKGSAPLLCGLHFESFEEGPCVQFLHTGPYEGMQESLARMRAAAAEQGYCIPVQNAHDIYLNDVRKTRPENLKTIMRFQVIPDEGR